MLSTALNRNSILGGNDSGLSSESRKIKRGTINRLRPKRPYLVGNTSALVLEAPLRGGKRFLVLSILSESRQHMREGSRGVV